MATDFSAARAALRREMVAPFHAWRLNRSSAATIREAESDLHNGWVREADRAVVELTPPYPWEAKGVTAVAVDEMHSWTMVDPLLLAHSSTGSWPFLETVVELIEDWEAHGTGTGRAWEPRSVAARAHRLAYVIHAAAVVDALDMSRWHPLARLGERHARRLQGITGGLDGLLAALGARSLVLRVGRHLDVGDRPGHTIAGEAADALDRRGMTPSSSPADHLTIVTALTAADHDDPDIDLTRVRLPAEEALAWLIATDGRPANFGATPLEPVSGRWRGADVAVRELVDPLVSDALRHVLSAGASGSPPTVDSNILEGADVAVIKPVWPSRPEQTGPFVAADRTTGAFVWHDAGRPLLVAAGTTSGALAGGASPRSEEAAGWLSAGAGGNALLAKPPLPTGAMSTRVGRLNNASYMDLSVEGADGRRRRVFVVNPDRWLLVVDWVDGPERRRIEQRFLLAPELDALDEVDHYLVTLGDAPVMWSVPLHGRPDPIGVSRGDWRGGSWWAPRPGRVAPATQIGWTVTGTQALMASLFSLVGPVRQEPSGEWSFAFSVDGLATRVALHETGLADMQETAE